MKKDKKKKIEDKREREKKVVRLMIALYCHGNHSSDRNYGSHWRHGVKRDSLCSECAELADYADARVAHCPHMETKTFCSNCKTHCYKSEMRERIRTVMRYSGPRMLFHHPVMAVRHLIESKKEKKSQGASGR